MNNRFHKGKKMGKYLLNLSRLCTFAVAKELFDVMECRT